jgi:2'-5' RNA ligase
VTDLIAIDVAVLPPESVSREAVRLSAALPPGELKGLRLGADCLPHVTLTQQFVRADELEQVLEVVGAALDGVRAPQLSVTGGGASGSTAWMAIAKTPGLVELHERLMAALEPFEQADGSEAAFTGGDARPGDRSWVSLFRRRSSFAAFTPHITLGHASRPPQVAPTMFSAGTIAACHLGRFCTCRTVLRRWTLADHRP